MSDTLQIELVNQTKSEKVYAHITGLALDHGNAWFLLQADGKTPYYPPSPSSIGSPIVQDCAIPLACPGASIIVTIPHIAGGRIYLSVGKPLVFLLNPGPVLVEPSVTNPSDPNAATNWGFCEFTFNRDQLYANISYVDFVSLPIALTLTTTAGATKRVLGMPPTGLDTVCSGLEAQDAKDGQGWASLIVKGPDGLNLRVLSPNQGIVVNPGLFAGYFEPFIDAVWEKYAAATLSVDTQAGFGTVDGIVGADGSLLLADQAFDKPSTRDIFNASSGPFVTGQDPKRNAIIPRLNADFNRSTLLAADILPAAQDLHYRENVTNHYARLVHGANVDGRGYAHPYDDVAPAGGPDQSGFVNDPSPKLLKVVVGAQDQFDINVIKSQYRHRD
jgi:hypothetical protein